MPDPLNLREFVVRSCVAGTRTYCTIVRSEDHVRLADMRLDVTECLYTLFLEFMGGLIPLLKARRTGTLKPEFVVYDPEFDNTSDSGDVMLESAPDSAQKQRQQFSDRNKFYAHLMFENKALLENIRT